MIETGPRILLAMTHPTMRALTSELLEREGGCRVRAVTASDQTLADAVDQGYPDVVVLDTGRFPDGCRRALRRFPSEHMIVIGPEPDDAYRAAALTAGAGGWLAREQIAGDLVAEVWRVLGDPAASVVDRSPAPRRTRMATPTSTATLRATSQPPDLT